MCLQRLLADTMTKPAEQVHMRRGTITRLALHDGTWHIFAGQQQEATAGRVFLTTGSRPTDGQLCSRPQVVPLDDALIPAQLAGAALACAYDRVRTACDPALQL